MQVPMNSSVDVDGWEYKTVNIAEYGGELDDHDVPEGALVCLSGC